MTAVAPETELKSIAFEVATIAADRERASVRVTGELEPGTVPLLLSVLRTHTRAGRRHLSVDLGAATAADGDVLEPLREAARALAVLGGTLRFENAAGLI